MKFRLAAFADEASQNIDEQITAMKANDIELLEIRGVDGTNIADITVSKAKEVREKLDAAGLSVWSLGSPYGKISLADDFNKHLEGKRAKANVKLFYKDNLLKEERGEVLFKKNGVSGIVIFNMSSYLSRLHLSSYQNYYLVIDFLPDLTYEEVNKYYQIDPTLKNLLQEDIAYEISSKHLDPKAYSLEIHNLYDLKNSQVTSGGVSLNEINLDLSLKSDNNVYLGGEMIDIDGECGGYNIEFALLSGIRIGNVI